MVGRENEEVTSLPPSQPGEVIWLFGSWWRFSADRERGVGSGKGERFGGKGKVGVGKGNGRWERGLGGGKGGWVGGARWVGEGEVDRDDPVWHKINLKKESI